MTKKRRRATKTRAELAEQVQGRSGGQCEWPRCFNRGEVVAHLLTRGMGGSPSRDTLENLGHLCHFHDWVMEPQNPKRGYWHQSERGMALCLLASCPENAEWSCAELGSKRWNRADALRRHIQEGHAEGQRQQQPQQA